MKKIIFAILNVFCFSLVHAGSMPIMDKKLSDTARADKCADWAKAEVKGISDNKKKSSEFKENFQQCLVKNKLPTHIAFSGKYKP